MERDGFACRRCRDTKATLNVNHLKYTGDPWDAPMEHLETLCEKCHEWRTNINLKFQLCPSASMPSVVEYGLCMSPYSESVMAFIYDCIVKADDAIAEKKKEPNGQKQYEFQKAADYQRGMAIRLVMEGFTPPWERSAE